MARGRAARGRPGLLPRGVRAHRGPSAPADISVVHSFQTNGMLISDAWCDLFERWDAKIGVSIDGPRAIHDAKRVTRAGRGTVRPDHGRHPCAAAPGHPVPRPLRAGRGQPARSRRDARVLRRCRHRPGCASTWRNPRATTSRNSSPRRTWTAHSSRSFESFWRIARAHGAVRFIREIDGMMPRVFRPAGTPMHNPQTTPLSILSVDRVGRVSTLLAGAARLHEPRLRRLHPPATSIATRWRRSTPPACARRCTPRCRRGCAGANGECGYFLGLRRRRAP